MRPVITYGEPVAIRSPCTGICTIDDARDHCTGCGRTLDEITRWLTMTAAERDAVIDALPERCAKG